MERRKHRHAAPVDRKIWIGLAAIVLGLLIVVLGIFRGNKPAEDDTAPNIPVGEQTQQPSEQPSEQPDPDSDREGQFGGEQEEEEIPGHATTDSGIACTLTQLDEAAIHTGELILVNNWTHFVFPEEQELVCIYEKKSSGYYVRDLTVYIAPVTMDAMDRMLVDFREQGGPKAINVVAGFRTAADQQHLFDQSAKRNGQAHAEKYVAQPGGSEHHTGFAVDFSILEDGKTRDYDGTGEYAWINVNCHEYGFIVRYEQGKEELTGIWDEPWHFRYVGVPHASKIRELGLCMEEYMTYLQDFTFEGEHLTIRCGTGTYEVWYTAGTEVYLPDSAEYQISGDNVGGFIVTVKVG